MKKRTQAPWFVWLTRNREWAESPGEPTYELYYGSRPPRLSWHYYSWEGYRLCHPFGGPIPATDWERLAPPSLHLEPGGGPLKVSLCAGERPE